MLQEITIPHLKEVAGLHLVSDQVHHTSFRMYVRTLAMWHINAWELNSLITNGMVVPVPFLVKVIVTRLGRYFGMVTVFAASILLEQLVLDHYRWDSLLPTSSDKPSSSKY